MRGVRVTEVCGDEAQRRGLTIAEATGNRQIESHLAGCLARLAAVHGDPADAFDYLTRAMRHIYDTGSFSLMPSAQAVLAVVFDRLGHHEPAATISEFAADPSRARPIPS